MSTPTASLLPSKSLLVIAHYVVVANLDAIDSHAGVNAGGRRGVEFLVRLDHFVEGQSSFPEQLALTVSQVPSCRHR